ncbi:MAG TPA: hypothetical protein VH092_33650 [Urbifossiella sp.]|nr:hypothetical protein [Urbifossiella sp.]
MTTSCTKRAAISSVRLPAAARVASHRRNGVLRPAARIQRATVRRPRASTAPANRTANRHGRP